MRQDKLTSAQAIIDNDHAYIHEKKGFCLTANTGSLIGDAVYKFSLTTPSRLSRKAVHLRPTTMNATANTMRLDIYEDSASTGGTLSQLRNRYREDSPVISNSTFKTGVTAAIAGKLLMASTAGGNFGNQPAGDAVDVVSDELADNFQEVTIYGTITGATTTVTSETVTLNGTTPVTTTITTWQTILGIETSAAVIGTVTFSENSGSATITTMTLGDTSSGVATITVSNARDTILRHDANGASTKSIGIIGTAPDGSALSSVDALNGATEENHNSDIFRTVTKILIGDVESARECWILRPEVIIQTTSAGSGGGVRSRAGGGSGSEDEFILIPATEYLFVVTNGSSTASTAYLNFFFYEEDMEA